LFRNSEKYRGHSLPKQFGGGGREGGQRLGNRLRDDKREALSSGDPFCPQNASGLNSEEGNTGYPGFSPLGSPGC